MKKIGLYFSVLTLIMLVWTGCEKEKTILPPREISEDVQVIADRYRQILVENDWFLAYKPENLEDSVYLKLSFSDGKLVSILSGYRDYHETQTGTEYDFEGKYTPVIIFSDNTVFGALASEYNGSVKFKITYVESDGHFELVRSDGYDAAVFRLVKLTPANEAKLTDQIDEILAQIAYEEEQARLSEEVRQKVKAFAEIESDFYFYNLTVDDFSAAIRSFDTTAREISLTYKEAPTSEPATVTVGYTLTPDGMVLNPAITYGNVSVDVIKFGNLIYEDTDNPTEATAIEISSAGNAGAGKMGYVHVAPYSYTMVNNRGVSTVDWLLDPAQQYLTGSGTGLFMYTAHDDAYYSDLVNHYRWIFADYVDEYIDNARGSTRLVNQIYFPASQSTSRNIQISTHRIDPSGNLFFLYRISLGKIEGSSALSVTLTETTGNTTAHKEAFDAYLNPQSPVEGVTVVPVIVGTTLRLRLVSRKDSRFWVEYVLNRTADRSHRFD